MRGQEAWRELESTAATSAKFNELRDAFWPEASRLVIDAWLDAEERKVTMFSFVRGTDRWSQLKRRFAVHTDSELEQTDEV